MAGGMHRGRSGPSLGERAALSGVRAVDPADAVDAVDAVLQDEPAPPPHSPAPRAPSGPAAPGGRPRAQAAAQGGSHGRHCWVRDAPGASGTRPGLLVEWRQREDGWYGRVAHVVDGRHGPVLVEAWLPATHLQQGRPRDE